MFCVCLEEERVVMICRNFPTASTIHRFFHKFVEKVTKELCPEHVKFPSTTEEAENVMHQYAAIGMAGAIGKMDCVHIKWDRCPYSQTNLHNGKEGCTTVGYEMIRGHLGKILSCKRGYYDSLPLFFDLINCFVLF